MAIPAIIYLILIVFGILQLILFFKLWGMCNDMRTLKNFVTMRFSLEAGDTGDDRYEPMPDKRGQVVKTGTIYHYTYKVYDDNVVDVFRSDGKLMYNGRLKTYPDYSMCGIWLGQSLYIYKDMDCAVDALRIYGNEKRIAKDGLMEKR